MIVRGEQLPKSLFFFFFFFETGKELNSHKPNIMASSVETMKQWIGKPHATIIYDSDVHPYTASTLFAHVRGRENIALVTTTADGDVFGAFFSCAVKFREEHFQDPNIFAFSFESHGRCATPQRFGLKPERAQRAIVSFCNYSSMGWFAWVGVFSEGAFHFGNEKSRPRCWNLSRIFEGMGDCTLSGKTWRGRDDEGYRCTRLIAVQFTQSPPGFVASGSSLSLHPQFLKQLRGCSIS